jgi:hypothetical protein
MHKNNGSKKHKHTVFGDDNNKKFKITTLTEQNKIFWEELIYVLSLH